MSDNSNKKLVAHRGYWVNGDDLLTLVNKLIFDATNKKQNIKVIGNPDDQKLEGVIMSLGALKDIIYRQEIFGDLIPVKEGGSTDEGNSQPAPKIILPN